MMTALLYASNRPKNREKVPWATGIVFYSSNQLVEALALA
jgi:hypothetical protein